MMHKFFLVSSIMAAIFFAPQVQAQSSPSTSSDQYYADLGYMPLNVRFLNGIGVQPDMARLSLGWYAHQNLDVEVMGMSTIKRDKDIGLTMLGLYLKPKYSISEESIVFAKIGVSKIHLYGRGYGTSSRASYGVGMQKKFGESIYGQIDFTRYGVGESREAVQGFSVSIGKSF
jgi:hypothetical protein